MRGGRVAAAMACKTMRNFLLSLALGLLAAAVGCLSDPWTPQRPPAATTQLSDAGTRRQQTITAVQKQGGKIQVDAGNPDRPVVSADLHRIRSAGADLDSLATLTKLRELNLYETGVTDADLQRLRGMPALQVLTLSGNTKITDAGLECVQGLHGLRALHLNQTRVTDTGLARLRGLSYLKEVSLFGTPITDEGLAHLSHLKDLEKLYLGEQPITDQGLAYLHGLRNLRVLYLFHTRVTTAGVEELRRLRPQLQVTHR
jgi:hypothetical protein